MGRSSASKSSLSVLITGCSSGFGLDAAARLAEAGHKVYATMRDLSKSSRLRNRIRGTSAEILRLDVTKPETIRAAVEHIAGQSGALDALVNNAGYGLAGFFADVSDDELRAQFDTNFFGALTMVRLALPLLKRSSRASVVNVSSISGRAALPGVSAYAASKWALEGACESLRIELALHGIKVYLVEPGVFRTKGIQSNAAFAHGATRRDSVYRPIYQRMRLMQSRRIERLPDTVAPVGKRIRRLIERRPRRFRWVVGSFRSPHYWTRRLLPFSVHEALIRRVLVGRTHPDLKE
jgi:NAD(P)-dependent dehydrogenase (short-subunit alcohol dehydrogenase family)